MDDFHVGFDHSKDVVRRDLDPFVLLDILKSALVVLNSVFFQKPDDNLKYAPCQNLFEGD